MGKQSGKKKQNGGQSGDGSMNSNGNGNDNIQHPLDKDMELFTSMAKGLKEEGNKLFQKRDHQGAMLKYEKAIKLLPRNHADVSHLRTSMATCYMQLGLGEYPAAIRECNMALEVTPGYSKALLKRARCYEALNRLDLAFRDVGTVLRAEPNNLMATEISDRIKKTLQNKGLRVSDTVIELPPEYVEPPSAVEVVKEKTRKKKKSHKIDDKKPKEDILEKNTTEVKVVVEERISDQNKEAKKKLKLVFGEDIRWAQVPLNCTLLELRKDIYDRFPSSGAVLIKYKDQEGDLVTVTTDEELRWAEASTESQGSFKLHVVEVTPQQDPFYEKVTSMGKGWAAGKGSYFIDDWIVEFAQLFKNHVGFDSDAYLNLHELGMKVYCDAMEETVTSEEAQELFDKAAEKFQEMTALALFNWGNVLMSKAKKKVNLPEDASRESMIELIKSAYDSVQEEYTNAGKKYEEALRIKPDFYEAKLALGQHQFEQAKLSWYYALGSHVDLETWPSTAVVLQLYNSAEDNIEKGMRMWEESEVQRMTKIDELKKVKSDSQKNDFEGLFEVESADVVAERATIMRSQINLLYGTILYERSVMEYKLGLPVWQDCLEAAVEKFELAGASLTDIGVMLKNHCSNNNALSLSFRIDEIVQAWNEMHEAKTWKTNASSVRLEPILRRRVSKLYHVLDA